MNLCIGMRREADGRYVCEKYKQCSRYKRLFEVDPSKETVRTMLCFKDGKPDMTYPYFI